MQIAVVGGGIIGCAVAWRLAQGGARVTVYDKGSIGGEASWAGAGMLAPGGEFGADSLWARLGVESLRMYPGFVRELGGEIDFRVCGAWEVALTDDEDAAVRRRVAAQRGMGIAVEEHPGSRWFYPEEAVVNPRDVVQALRAAGEKLGVSYQEGVAVAVQEVAADGVVCAMGAWAPQGVPVRGHLISYALEPGSLPHIVRGGHYYVLQRRTGETIAGADMERVGFDKTVKPAAVEEIRAAAERLVPALAGVAISGAWTGLRPGVNGDEPVVGRRGATNVWDAYGHFRNGILLAPITAEMIAKEMLPSLGKG